MTRQEEYYEEASKYAKTHHSKADNDFQTAMNIAVQKAFVAAAEWKDSQPQIIEIFGKRVKIVEHSSEPADCMKCAFIGVCLNSSLNICQNAEMDFNRYFVEVDENGKELNK